MEILLTHRQVVDKIDEFTESLDSEVVLHGTPKRMNKGDILTPHISRSPTMGADGNWIDLNDFPPFVFAAPLDAVDLAIFHATIKAYGVPFSCGARAEAGRKLTLMANDDVKTWATHTNPVGTLCFLSAEGFVDSPHGSWAELVNESEVQVLGAYAVHYTALSVRLEALSPLNIPGISEEELRRLTIAAREAAAQV